MIAVLLITHGHFGQELLRTSQDIVGRQENAAALAVTSETSPENLSAEIDGALAGLDSKDGTLFLVDMLGGTPCNLALLKARHLNAEVVTGVNLYMMISCFTRRQTLDLKALAAKVAEDGRRAVVLAKDMLMKKLG